MAARVIHFEMPSTDMAASRKFYENVFGWTFSKYAGQEDYWLAMTGDPSTPGIDGALGGAANEFKAIVNTVGVDDLDRTLEKVRLNGGEIVLPKEEIPGVGYLSYVREPGGAPLGIIQMFPNPRM